MSPIQKNIFLDKEGDGWFERNKIIDEKLADKINIDPVLQIIEHERIQPKNLLEIGASNGWRLSVLKQRIAGLECTGIEPSQKAVTEAYSGIDMHQGTADKLPFKDMAFDMVIFGFCLYLCDRSDLFQIAAEADRVLSDGGHMIIYDFLTEEPYRNPYAHTEGMFSYKMDYSHLFTWNPAYKTLKNTIMPHPGTTDESPDNRIGITLLQKNLSKGWPDNPKKK